MKKINITPNIPGIIIAILMAVSVFLPFISTGRISTSLIENGGDGKYVIAAAVIGLIFAVLGVGAGMCFSGLAAGFVFYIDNNLVTERIGDNPFAAALIKNDIGWYLLIGSAVAMFIVGIIAIVKKK